MKKLIAAMLLTVGLAFGQVSVGVGIRIGPSPPPRVLRVRPVAPGPGFFWVAGYWYPVRGHYRWHDGYWTRAPFPGARWVPPRYEGRMFFDGYWEGPRGRFEHDHRWDRDRRLRDFDRDRDRDRR